MKVWKLIIPVIMLLAMLTSCEEEEEFTEIPDGLFKGIIQKDSIVVDSFAVSFPDNVNTTEYGKNSTYTAVTDSLRLSLSSLGKWQFMINVKLPGPVGMGLFSIEEGSGSYFIDSTGKAYYASEGELAITNSSKIKEPGGRKDYFSDGRITVGFVDSLRVDTIEFTASFDNIRMKAE